MEVLDVSYAIVPKSDQLNAEDLIAGPITAQIERVTAIKAPQQPVSVHLVGYPGRPWKPCKTSLKLLINAWGPNAAEWAGRWVKLFRDESVSFGDQKNCGGIRSSHISHIKKQIVQMLTQTRGKRVLYRIDPMDAPEPAEIVKVHIAPLPVAEQTPTPIDSLTLLRNAGAAATKRGWTRDQVTALLGGPAANTAEEDRPILIERLNGAPPVEQNEGGEE